MYGAGSAGRAVACRPLQATASSRQRVLCRMHTGCCARARALMACTGHGQRACAEGVAGTIHTTIRVKSAGWDVNDSQVPKKLRGPYSCCMSVTKSTASPTVRVPLAMPCGGRVGGGGLQAQWHVARRASGLRCPVLPPFKPGQPSAREITRLQGKKSKSVAVLCPAPKRRCSAAPAPRRLYAPRGAPRAALHACLPLLVPTSTGCPPSLPPTPPPSLALVHTSRPAAMPA